MSGEARERQPTAVYRVDAGDVLFIDLQNATLGSRYCDVRVDGTIDFPLAGEKLIAVGKTVEEIEAMLISGIKLFAEPKVRVEVREYRSHKVAIAGISDQNELTLEREAMPFYAVRSKITSSHTATKIIIKRTPQAQQESYDLADPATGEILIYPGTSIEFL